MAGRLALAVMLLAALAGQAFAAKPAPSGVSSANQKSPAALTSVQGAKLAAAKSAHLKAKAGLPQEQQVQLDRVAEVVKGKLLAALSGGDLLSSATHAVSETIPGLDGAESEVMAHYVLGAIATGTWRNAETQMSFNLQYLQLVSQMQALTQDYEALGEILKAKHDQVENSISNVR